MTTEQEHIIEAMATASAVVFHGEGKATISFTKEQLAAALETAERRGREAERAALKEAKA